MKPVKRIAIIGNAGSGKSTLARELQGILKLPLYHLDQYFWKPGWVESNYSEYMLIHDKLCDNNEWIIEGMNLRLLSYRIIRADMVILLDIPRHICIWRIFKRTIRYYGKETPGSAAGCTEKFNREFFKFIKWVWRFNKKYPSKTLIKIIETYSDSAQIYVLKSSHEVEQFVKTFC